MKSNSSSIYIGSIGRTGLYLDLMLFPSLVGLFFSGGMGVLLLILPSLFVHEAAHILSAHLFGCKAERFTVMPLGGVLEMDISKAVLPTAQRVAIYFSGPFVNMVLYAFLYAVGTRASSLVMLQLSFINGTLAVVNILPLFPLDGGNILKTLLSLKLDERRVTNVLLVVNTVLCSVFFAVFVLVFVFEKQFLWQIPMFCVFAMYSVAKEKSTIRSNRISSVLTKDSFLRRKQVLYGNRIYVLDTATVATVLKMIKDNCFNVIAVVDGDFNVLSEITEKELIVFALENGVEVSLKNVVKSD